MTKQQFLKHDPVKAQRKEAFAFIAFAAMVVVPFVVYLTNALAK